MLKNAYLLAKIGADTAENERYFAENLLKIGNYPTGPRRPAGGRSADSRGARDPALPRGGTRAPLLRSETRI